MTKFEKAVKTRLLEMGKTQRWLMVQVSKVYDGVLNPVVINQAIKGENNIYPRVKIAIAGVLNINAKEINN